jgi:hypothetical protein
MSSKLYLYAQYLFQDPNDLKSVINVISCKIAFNTEYNPIHFYGNIQKINNFISLLKSTSILKNQLGTLSELKSTLNSKHNFIIFEDDEKYKSGKGVKIHVNKNISWIDYLTKNNSYFYFRESENILNFDTDEIVKQLEISIINTINTFLRNKIKYINIYNLVEEKIYNDYENKIKKEI